MTKDRFWQLFYCRLGFHDWAMHTLKAALAGPLTADTIDEFLANGGSDG